jgi:hypothetical protein
MSLTRMSHVCPVTAVPFMPYASSYIYILSLSPSCVDRTDSQIRHRYHQLAGTVYETLLSSQSASRPAPPSYPGSSTQPTTSAQPSTHRPAHDTRHHHQHHRPALTEGKDMSHMLLDGQRHAHFDQVHDERPERSQRTRDPKTVPRQGSGVSPSSLHNVWDDNDPYIAYLASLHEQQQVREVPSAIQQAQQQPRRRTPVYL